MLRLSFSQLNMWQHCPRQWYYSYVLRLPDKGDKSYALAGTIVHKMLERAFPKSLSSVARVDFERLWLADNLDKSIIAHKKEDYWTMVLSGEFAIKPFTKADPESKIYYPDFACVIDVLYTHNPDVLGRPAEFEIVDWKTSTRNQWNEKEYKQQLLVYAWAVRRKYGVIPYECRVHYLKGGPSETLVIHPDEVSVALTGAWIESIRQEMEDAIKTGIFPCKTNEDGSCNPFCPYKETCKSTSDGKLHYTLTIESGLIHIDGIMDNLLMKGLEKEFSYEVQNAHFIRLNSKWDGIQRLYDKRTHTVRIGFMKRLIKVLDDYCTYKKKALDITIVDKRPELKHVNFNTMLTTELRPYQIDAVDAALKERIGVLELATSAGKTLIASELIRRADCTTLFLVDRKELLHQTKKVFERELKIPIGIVGDDEENILPVTIATIQTIHKRTHKYAQWLNTIQLLIVDEAHISAAKTVRKVCGTCPNTLYRIGLTGSNFRDDGHDLLIEEAVGQTIFKLPLKRLIELGFATKPTIRFHPVGALVKHRNYHDDYTNNVELNVERNDYVITTAKAESALNNKVLILVKTIAHGKVLSEAIPGSTHMHGSVPKKKRTAEFEDFINGTVNVCVATTSIAQKGLDIPRLKMLINAAGHKGDVASLQSLGRIVRKIQDKTSCEYIDFLDDGYFSRHHSHKRKAFFESEGHEVTTA